MKDSIGVIIRCFSKTPDQVDAQVEAVRKTIEKINHLRIPEAGFFKIDVVIPVNQDFVDVDCGFTKPAVVEMLKEQNYQLDVMVKTTAADLFCGLLNRAMYTQAILGCSHSLVLSTGCNEYITDENIGAMISACFRDGALVSGLALPELEDSILKGAIANTFALWNIASLMTIGGFDLRAANALKVDKLQPYLRGFYNGEDVFYPVSGVEEIIPILRMINLYGSCIKPVLPFKKGKWAAPDPVTDPEGYKRHIGKMASKESRQTWMANQVGSDLSDLARGLMP